MLRSVLGLVTDGTVPAMDHFGSNKLVAYQFTDQEENGDSFTYGYGAVPSGAYSVVYDPVTVNNQAQDPPPPNPNPNPNPNPCPCSCGGLTYNSRETSCDIGYGPGWSDADELPRLSIADNMVEANFGANQNYWFQAQSDGSYTALYGAQMTLVHDTADGLFILTQVGQGGSSASGTLGLSADTGASSFGVNMINSTVGGLGALGGGAIAAGTTFTFYDSDQTVNGATAPEGGLKKEVAPSGATIQVTAWTTQAVDGIDSQIKTVQYMTTPNGAPYQERDFVWGTSGGAEGHITSVTLWQLDGSAKTGVREMTYTYYNANDPSSSVQYGLPGDLKTVLTQQWDAAANNGAGAFVGTDTYYFRYYTDDSSGHGFANGLERALLPNAYAALYTATNGDPEDASEAYIAGFTCYYYQYDANCRVSEEVVYGNSNQTDYTTTISGNADGYNNWARKTVETDLDGAVTTTYTNYLGQTLLTDIDDSTSTPTHTITYNVYDENDNLVHGGRAVGGQ